MSSTEDLYLHVVRRETYLELLALELYGDLDSPQARDFVHYNQLAADESNRVVEGQLLYLPEPTCQDEAIETAIINLIGQMNTQIRYGMDARQRRVIAERPQLVHNVSESPDLLLDGLSFGNTAAGALISFGSDMNRMVGESLKELERAYVNSFNAHKKLTPHFYQRRRQIYSRLDTTLGRYGRMLALGNPVDVRAKSALKVSTKSQVLHWKRQGGATNIDGFRTHFDRFEKTSRYLKAGGLLTSAIGISINELRIKEACRDDSESCDFTKYSLRGETIGALGFGAGGGALASWGTCSLVLGLPTGGTSMLWCAVATGTAASATGGYYGAKAGKAGGEWLFETIVR